MRRAVLWAVVTVLAIGASMTANLSPAFAALGVPVLTTTSTPANSAGWTVNPVLSWHALSGATKYDVDVSAVADFSTKLYSVSTANLNATPPTDLTTGTLYWRVRGHDSSNAAGPYASATIVKVSPDKPTLLYPADSASLEYPGSALYYRWSPVPGAKQYEIQIDNDPLFVGAPAPVATSNVWYSPTTPPVFGTPVYWRVRSKSNGNVYSQWSDARSFSMAWGTTKTTLVGPESTNAYSIEKVSLAWSAIPGAEFYQLDVSPDSNFNNPIYNHVKVEGTAFTPLATLPAGAYYWRVRPMSTSAVPEPGNWSDTWTFTKAWPATAALAPRPGGSEDNRFAQVSLIAPADADHTLGQPEFSWTPQRSASHYEIQIGSDVNFSPSTYGSCQTNHTIAPTSSGNLAAYPSDVSRPTSSSVNFTPGATVPNLVTTPLGTGGDVNVFNQAGRTHVILDVVGWYLSGAPPPGSRLNPVTPSRLLDTRTTAGAPSIPAGGTRSLAVLGRGVVPNSAAVKGLVLNVTVTGPGGAGFLTVFAGGTARPVTSNLNYRTGQTTANQVIVPVGANGAVSLYSLRKADAVVDVVGWMG